MTKPLPLVLQLQAEAINQDIPVSQLLLLAKAIASKLDQKDALRWIDKEIDGYFNGAAKVPEYRRIGGQPKAFNPHRGWMPIQFGDTKIAKVFSEVPLLQSVPSIEKELASAEGSLSFTYPAEIANTLRELIEFPADVAVSLSRGSVWSVVEAVRNLVLSWSLELEKAGILGEDMTFTAKERKEGAAVTQQYFIQNVGVLGNVSDSAKVTNTQTATVTLDSGEIRAFAREALALMGQLPGELRPKLGPALNELRTEAAKEKPDHSALREMLTSVRTIAEGAAGNVAASGIVTMIGKLLGP